jgi:hypothetical protein
MDSPEVVAAEAQILALEAKRRRDHKYGSP